jgi:thiamine kinase-like enzyme
VLRPEDLLAEAEERAHLAVTLLPALRPAVDALLGRLSAELPALDRAVPSHGDFRIGHLLAARDGLTVIDFDAMCLADPALDVAAYVAGAEDPDGVLEPLLEGYGARPQTLDWYLATTTLMHAVGPFRRMDPQWPERVEATVRTAMEALNP